MLTESSPRDLQARALMLGAASAALVAVGPGLQRASALLEALSFLKDRRKRVVAGPIAYFARPSGAVGAVCAAYGQWHDHLFAPDVADGVREQLQAEFDLLRATDVHDALALDQEPALDQAVDSDSVDLEHDTTSLVFVSTSDGADAGNDAARVVSALSTLESQGVRLSGDPISVSTSDPLPSSLSTLRRASVVVVVITADLSDATDSVRVFRTLVEAARRMRKPLVPVKEARATILTTGCWLSLVLAGRLWYEVDAHRVEALHTPYAQLPNCPCRVDDACPATDLLLSVNALLEAPWRQRAIEGVDEGPWEAAMLDAAKENALLLGLSAEHVQSLLERVDGVMERLRDGGWQSSDVWRTLRDDLGVPLTSTDVSNLLAEDASQQASEWPAPTFSPAPGSAGTGRVRYQVRRLDFSPLPSVVDARGVFVAGTAPDVLLSYQWGAQDRVLGVHQQGRVSGLRAWLDVFGHMQGNVNAAMARAVEGVACVVVFATRAYVQSVNCRLECQYAVHCGKPLLLAFLEDDPRAFELPEWVATSMDAVTVVDLREHADNRDVDAMDALFAAIRRFAALRGVQDHKRPRVSCDGSFRLFAATAALRHAARSLESDGGQAESASATPGVSCSRCGVLFRPTAAEESGSACRKHSAYYLGGMGGLMSGRWVCCSEPSEDGPGCEPAPHMAQSRAWIVDPNYGTHTWSPDSD